MSAHLAKLKRFAGFDAGFEFSNSEPTHAAAAASGPSSSQQHHASSSLVSSAASISHSNVSALSGVSWQEIRLSGWMLSYEQSCALLRSLPQLQLLSVHLLPSSSGSFTSPNVFRSRLLFAGGDYLQRQIATYITRTCMRSNWTHAQRARLQGNSSGAGAIGTLPGFFSHAHFCVLSALYVSACAFFRSR
jgi:hypothetical protein